MEGVGGYSFLANNNNNNNNGYVCTCIFAVDETEIMEGTFVLSSAILHEVVSRASSCPEVLYHMTLLTMTTTMTTTICAYHHHIHLMKHVAEHFHCSCYVDMKVLELSHEGHMST